VSTKTCPKTHSIRPLQFKLKKPLYSQQYSSKFCIISKDPQRALKDKLANLNVPLFARVVGYSKLNRKFPTYKEKRAFLYSFDQFFCDYKIYDLLKKPLGRQFYSRKK